MTEREKKLHDRIVEVLKTVHDPEIPVDIYELGLIYDLQVDEDGIVTIDMTLTSPMCPVAEELPGEVKHKVEQVEGVNEVDVQLVWDPPWTMERLTEATRLKLGLL